MKNFHTVLKSLSVTVVLLLICGLGFPLLLAGVSGLIFPEQAKGNLVEVNGEAVGSEFVGQDFTEPYFMKCRPSAVGYNTYTVDENGNKIKNDGSEFGGIASGGYNYAASNPALAERVDKDIEEFLKNNPDVKKEDLPGDLFTASGSGLDPHISPEAAKVQLPGIAEASGLSIEELETIVSDNTKGKLLGIFGDETVNVLMVNISIAEKMELI